MACSLLPLLTLLPGELRQEAAESSRPEAPTVASVLGVSHPSRQQGCVGEGFKVLVLIFGGQRPGQAGFTVPRCPSAALIHNLGLMLSLDDSGSAHDLPTRGLGSMLALAYAMSTAACGPPHKKRGKPKQTEELCQRCPVCSVN